MKKVFFILIIFSMVLISCSKKEKIDVTVDNKKEITNDNKVEEKSIEYVYVNSVEGLKIRKSGNSESEKIGS